MTSNEQILQLLGREQPLFEADLNAYEGQIRECVANSRFLVIGGAGSIGRAVSKELFKRNPRLIHVVDLSENNMVELVRDLRSSVGYTDGDFKTFCIDCGDVAFEAMVDTHGPYDYVFNLSALKHVRGERDPFTLMRMIEVNILNTLKTIELCGQGLTKYFCVSTDKAANPVNMMGASKRIMEMFLVDQGKQVEISTARFANVAFSDGSLLDGFRQRFEQQQPLAAPGDITRYFVTPQEAGELCMMSGLLGGNGDIFFPQNERLEPITFSDIACRFLQQRGYEPALCISEDEARSNAQSLISDKQWPCFFSDSDTTGEKPYEEFFTDSEQVDTNRFQNLGVVQNTHEQQAAQLRGFLETIESMRKARRWEKNEIVSLFESMIPEFRHLETGKYLDQKM